MNHLFKLYLVEIATIISNQAGREKHQAKDRISHSKQCLMHKED